jgi:ABC-2 type transport system permease protein
VSLRANLTTLRYAIAAGWADFAVVYTWRTWTAGWLTRVLCQVAFFALIGRLLGSAERTQFLLVGNAALIAAVESCFVCARWRPATSPATSRTCRSWCCAGCRCR